MRLNQLTAAEMLAISQPWLDPAHAAHKALVKVSEISPLLNRLTGAHQLLLAQRPQDGSRAAALQRELAVLDAEHDELARGIHSLCEGLAILSEGEDERSNWERLRMLLLPVGLGIVNQSYTAEAGNAILLEQRLEDLSPADKKLLKGQLIGHRSLYDLVLRWIAVGLAIGNKEQERQSLAPGPTQAEAHSARTQWQRVVSALVALLELASPSPEVEQYILGPLRAASDRAARRKTGTKPGPVEPPPTP